MRIEQLYYLVEIARYNSFSSAAEKLHISQPSLSQAINKLEKELGVKLFKRTRTGSILTENGKEIVKKAQEVLLKFEELEQLANKKSSTYSGTLSIGVIPSIYMALLPTVLEIYKNKFPYVNLEIKEGGTHEIKQEIKDGKLDIGLIAIFDKNDKYNENLYYEKLLVGKIMACVGKNHPLASQKTILPSQIIEYPIIAFNSDKYILLDIVSRVTKKYGEFKTLFKTENSESAKKVIAQGVAIGFYSDLSLRNDPYVQLGQIFPLEISNLKEFIFYGWARSKEYHFSIIAREFITIFKSHVNTLQQNHYNNLIELDTEG